MAFTINKANKGKSLSGLRTIAINIKGAKTNKFFLIPEIKM
jgi:hypothetical protein